MRQIVLVAHNIRSTHNVGSLLRTAEGLGVQQIYVTGYTPYPATSPDTRLPHITSKLTSQIKKTALGAESLLPWTHRDDISDVLGLLKTEGFLIAALEQQVGSTPLQEFKPTDKLAIIVGNEISGLGPAIVTQADIVVEIPMFGKKESSNVVQAAAMVLYHVRFTT